MKLVVTGAAGFIGSTFVRQQMRNGGDNISICALDKLTYAGNMENLAEWMHDPRLTFVQADICDRSAVTRIFEEFKPDGVIHFAAESHVDRSILAPDAFVQTNVNGSFTLVDQARRSGVPRFLHVSTDEVYGSIDEPHEAVETSPLICSSPYSASKGSSDLLVLSYHHTYKYDVVVTRASNNYGPYQFPEKLIPLMICNALDDKPLPVYGDGMQVRDWLHAEDHCRAILSVFERGRSGEVYNVEGGASLPNLEVIRRILQAVGKPESLMKQVSDRPGHDRRYALSGEKLYRETGWRASVGFNEGLLETVRWYQTHQEWVARVRSGEYLKYYDQNYKDRSQSAHVSNSQN